MKRDNFVIGFLLGLLVGASSASIAVSVAKAAPFTPELEADYAYAEQWWGAAPVHCSSIDREVVTKADIGGALGRATQPQPPTVLMPCVMLIAAETASPCALRQTVVHEYGHLLGYGHSTDPANVMYPTGNAALVCGEADAEAAEDAAHAASVIAYLQRGLDRTRARCHRYRTSLQHRLCRHREGEWREMIAEARAELDGV